MLGRSFIMTAVALALLSTACTDNPVPDEYEYVQDTNRYVMVVHGDLYSIGKLDDNGNFITDKRYVNMSGMLSNIPAATLINIPLKRQKHVYEYRSGRLIKGQVDEEGNFIPDLGSKVISFKDYHYSPDALRIYNLPGKFVRKGEKETTK
jgi:hypothetical protein